MTDPDNFLSRWSRRKRGDDADQSRLKESAEPANDQTAPRGGRPGEVISKADAGAPPEFDVTKLPPIDAIDAGTDISAFMKKGVPSALRHAALRRAWSADPAIRDFMGPTENYWDAVGPDGIPGFGELDPGLDVKRMVSELFGEVPPERPQAESDNSVTTPEASTENLKSPEDSDKAVASEIQPAASPRAENVAAQKNTTASEPLQKMTRRHGGAMPE
jgi:hypothetical protein